MWIELQKNKLTGSIPNFSNLPNLKILHIQKNKLKSMLPSFSSLSSNLQEFYFYENEPICRKSDVDYSKLGRSINGIPECKPIAQATEYQTRGISPWKSCQGFMTFTVHPCT